MNLLNRFLEKTEFDSYDDFIANYRLKIPQGFNFGYDVVDEYARLCPQKPALLWYNDHEEKHYTFGDLARESNRLANAFRSLGIGRGDAVLFMLRERPEAWFTFIALAKLGAVAVPATYQLRVEDIVYRCNTASIKLICAVDDPEPITLIRAALPECVTAPKTALVGDAVPADFVDLRRLAAASSDLLERVPNRIDDIMLMYFSSGTTGHPKMIAHDYAYPLGHITTAKYWQHVVDGGRHFTYSDSGWAKFTWGKIFGQWIAGAEIIGYDSPRFSGVKLLHAIEHLKPVTFCAPPTVYRNMICEDLTQYDLSSITHFCSAGEPLNPEIIERIRAVTGQEIYEGFGQSETTVILANFGFDPIKYGSTGKPAPLYRIDLLDTDGNACEEGVVGAIVVRNGAEHPAGLFREYSHNPAAMQEAWKDGVYNTMDTAWRDSDGYYWFEGRNDDVIKCSGYRIGPFEVESVLQTHPAVLECAVTAVPDPLRGQVVKATIILNRGYTPSEALENELKAHVKKNTAPYKYPRVIEFVDSLPKTHSGKIKRNEIKARDAVKYASQK